MKLDLYMGAETDQKMADKYRKIGPTFRDLLQIYVKKAFAAKSMEEFDKMYFSDSDVAYLARFVVSKLKEKKDLLSRERFASLSKKNAKIYKVTDDVKDALLLSDLMNAVLEQNPKFKAAFAERTRFNLELRVFDLPANIDFPTEEVVFARLKRKNRAYEADKSDINKKAAYDEACKLAEACLRYNGLVRCNVIKPIRKR